MHVGSAWPTSWQEFYDDSPCLGTGEGGSNIGIYQGGDVTVVPTSSDTFFVATNGNDTSGDGSETLPWATIGKAAQNAIAGDTVIVGAGTYSERVSISEGGSALLPVIYRASGDVVVNGGGSRNRCFEITYVSNVALDGFKCKSSTEHGLSTIYTYDLAMSNMTVWANASSGGSGL